MLYPSVWTPSQPYASRTLGFPEQLLVSWVPDFSTLCQDLRHHSQRPEGSGIWGLIGVGWVGEDPTGEFWESQEVKMGFKEILCH